MNNPPYPDDLAAKGWSLELDHERIEQSDTWAIATAEQRPWLLMLWLMSWRQVPIASLPDNDKLIAARIGMPLQQFTEWREVLLSGWTLASNGRLYHSTLTEYVLKMAGKRDKDRARVAEFRAKRSATSEESSGVTRYTPATPANDSVTTSDVRVSSAPQPQPLLQPIPSEANASGAAPPVQAVDNFGLPEKQPAKAAEPPTDRDAVFANGVVLLTAAGVAEKHARSFLAVQCKTYGELAVRQALERCADQQPIQPVPWIQADLAKTGKGKKAGRHTGFEDINYREGIAADGSLI